MDKEKLIKDIADVLSANMDGLTFEVEGNRIRIADEEEDVFLYWQAEKHKTDFDLFAPTIARMQLNGAPSSLIRKVNSFLNKQIKQTTLDF